MIGRGYEKKLRQNEHGVWVEIRHYDTDLGLLEDFFDMIGSPYMKGRSSKVIGKTLMIWERPKK